MGDIPIFARAALEARAERMLREDGFDRIQKIRLLRAPIGGTIQLHVQEANRFAYAEVSDGPTNISISDWFDRHVVPAVKSVEKRLTEEIP